MVDLPVDPERTREFAEQRYLFDFKCVTAGISGYAWSFPCLIENRPHLNVGIYDQHPPHTGSSAKSPLPDRLREAFPELDLDGFETRAMNFKAFPIRWFNPRNRFAIDRVMLAGDAAGVDPLMGEGISCAFEHGKLAARSIGELLAGDRYGARAAMTPRCIAGRSARSWASSPSRRATSMALGIGCTSNLRASARRRKRSASIGTMARRTSTSCRSARCSANGCARCCSILR